MFAYLRRGLAAGTAAGAGYGLFVAFVAGPLIAVAEGYEAANEHGHAHHAHEGAATGRATVDLVAAAPDVAGGLLWGVLLGGAFGVAYYLFEPALPSRGATRSSLLGVAGFVVASGAPWLALPPRPPGTTWALGTDARLAVYAGMMVAGALACALSLATYRRLSRAGRDVGVAAVVAACPLAALVVGAALAPPVGATTPAPATFTLAYAGVVIVGQLGLWAALAGGFALLSAREGPADLDGGTDADRGAPL
ncbi:CbtA family protein [Halegenticoccus tardaugens]|uniref:CbtA family protein n=1 Tax=Halegenticoccus tardaugens TaxID=2071624 RepID=UPI00100A803C|nr:CbtA family protein [Halegenticoccus tardaugens]